MEESKNKSPHLNYNKLKYACKIDCKTRHKQTNKQNPQIGKSVVSRHTNEKKPNNL